MKTAWDLRFHVRSDATELVISRADDPWFQRWVEQEFFNG
jgi:hypothetical protein